MPSTENDDGDMLHFVGTIQETRMAVWRLLHYMVSDANRDLGKEKPGLIQKVVPALQKDPAQLSNDEVAVLLGACNDLSQLVSPATNESLWLKEKLEEHERAVIQGKEGPFSATNKAVKNTYTVFRWLLWGIGLLFLIFQAYTYFISDSLQKVTDQKVLLQGIEDQIEAAKLATPQFDGMKEEFRSKSPFVDLLAQRQVVWAELNNGYCILRKVSILWGWLYPVDTIACGGEMRLSAFESQLEECGKKPDTERQKCEKDLEKRSQENLLAKETQERAERDSFFAATNAALRVCNYLIIPALLGCLGALAYVIRGVLDSFANSSFTLGARRRWGMRVALGPLLGVISGIAISPDIADFKEISFSPLIWAFLMGYSVEFAFSLFDALIQKGRAALGFTNGRVEAKAQKAEAEATPAVPAITSLSPPRGPTAGGTVVAISGAGFTKEATVQFGTSPATATRVLGSNRIDASTPPGSGTVDVRVTTAVGTSPTTPESQFTYEAGMNPDEEGDTHVCDATVSITDITTDEELPPAEGGVEKVE